MTSESLTTQPHSSNASAVPIARGTGFPSFRLLIAVLFAVSVSALVGLAVIQFRESLEAIGNWGYLGIFLVETANSAAIFVPTPSIAYTFAMASILNPFLIGIIGGIGASLGELIGYALGASGRQMLEGSRLQAHFEAIARRRVGPALFAFAALPVPFDIAGIWAGTVHYPPRRFLLWVTAGKIIKITGIAFAGYYGVGWLLGFLN